MKFSRQLLSMVTIGVLIASAISAINLNANNSGTLQNQNFTSPLMSSLGNVTGIQPSTISLYPVYFNETGLPSGTAWAVNVSGSSHASSNSSIRLSLPSGAYSYSIENSLNFYTSSPNGQFTVLNHGININTSYNGRLSVTGYVNLATGKLVNSSSSLTTTMTVFPVYGIFDNFSHSFVVLGYSNSMIYEVSQ